MNNEQAKRTDQEVWELVHSITLSNTLYDILNYMKVTFRNVAIEEELPDSETHLQDYLAGTTDVLVPAELLSNFTDYDGNVRIDKVLEDIKAYIKVVKWEG